MFRAKYILFFIFLSSISFSQSLKYDVYFMNKKVGSYKIKNIKNNNKSIIKVGGSSTFWFISTYIMKFASESVFVNNHFIYSNTIRYLNKNKQDSVRVKYNNDKKYKVFSYKTGDRIIDNIFFTGNMMYFSEPNNCNKIFSENKGYFVDLRKEKDHIFVSEDKISKEKITYFYENGILVKAVIEKGLISLTMKLRKNEKD